MFIKYESHAPFAHLPSVFYYKLNLSFIPVVFTVTLFTLLFSSILSFAARHFTSDRCYIILTPVNISSIHNRSNEGLIAILLLFFRALLTISIMYFWIRNWKTTCILSTINFIATKMLLWLWSWLFSVLYSKCTG